MFTDRDKLTFKGIGALVLTPFDQRLMVDFEGLAHNVRHMIDNGLDASCGFLVVNGSMGECYAMTLDERKQVIRAVVEVASGRIPVVAGCSDTSIENVVALSRYANEVGADAAMIVPPYYSGCSEEQIYSFYACVSRETEIPIIIYNNPAVAGGVDLSIPLLHRLAKLDRVIGLKQATTNARRFVQAELLTGELLVFSGSSALQPFGTLAGMAGFISSLASFHPRLEISLWQALSTGDYATARQLHREEMKLYDWWWSGGVRQPSGEIVHVKKAMDLIGLRGGHVRPPLLPISEEETEGLTRILREWRLLQ